MRNGMRLLFDPQMPGGGGGGAATMDDIAKSLGRIEENFTGMGERVAAIEARIGETSDDDGSETVVGRISALAGDVDGLADEMRRRMRAVREGMFDGRGRYRGIFGSRERALAFGLHVAGYCYGKKWAIEKLKKDAPDLYEITELANKDLTSGDFAAGGAFAPEAFSADLIRHVEEAGVFPRLARRVPMAEGRRSWPKRTGGLTVYYPDEGVAITESDVSTGRVAMEPIKYATYTEISSELDEDSVIVLGELIAMEASLAFSTALDNNAFNGDGTSAYARAVGILQSGNVGEVAMASGDTSFADLSYDYLVDMQSASPTYVTNPVWGISRTLLGQCRKIADSNGNPIVSDTPLLVGEPRTLLGDPVHIAQTMPAMTDDAVSTSFLWHGQLDISHMYGVRRGMTIAASEHVKFAEDMIGIKVTGRFGIAERQADAVTKITTAAE